LQRDALAFAFQSLENQAFDICLTSAIPSLQNLTQRWQVFTLKSIIVKRNPSHRTFAIPSLRGATGTKARVDRRS
jgi:hypothetical protein